MNSTGSVSFSGSYELALFKTHLIVFSNGETGEVYNSYIETYNVGTGKVVGSRSLVNNPFMGNGGGDLFLSIGYKVMGHRDGISRTYSGFDVNAQGRIIGVTPVTGVGPDVGMGKVSAVRNVAKRGRELFKFGGSAGRHMAEPGRAVPVQILEQAIKGSKGVADPKGSRALMHSVEMFRNAKPYKLDVLYDKATNTIWHFQYSTIKP